MAHGPENDAAEGKLDLVPLIDCVMLLLMFFILTSTFNGEDKVVSALLPKGGPVDPIHPIKVTQIPTVRIVVIPGEGRTAQVRIGGGESMIVDTAALAQVGTPQVEATLSALHAGLAERLLAYEQDGARTAQLPIEIHCATRLPWSCALAVYDGVRVYEREHLPSVSLPLEEQRSVAFAAPTVRNTSTDNERDELYRLEHLR